MGAKSTIDISREEAISRIESMWNHASDEAISDVLEILNDDADSEESVGLHNFRITK